MTKISGKHNKVKLTPVQHKTIRLWIDSCAPYAGTSAAIGTGSVGGCWGNNKPVRVMADKWPDTAPAAEAVKRRCTSCHGKWLPKHVTDRIPINSWGDMLSWTRPLTRFSRHRIYNLSRPDKSLILLVPLAKDAGGYATEKPPAKPAQVKENRSRAPKAVKHHVVFKNREDPDYIKILTHIKAAKAKLDEIKRFDMPGFRPNIHYVREMKRYGVLSEDFDAEKDPIDCYETDEKYWRLFWHKPQDKK
jgi:hypothetical protein